MLRDPRRRQVITDALTTLVQLVPERWRPVALAAITLLAAALAAVYGPVDTPVASSYEATMITAEMEDIDLVRHTGIRAMLKGDAIPQAPLIDGWDNQFLRTGEVQRWCLDARDPQGSQILREALTWLANRFPERFRWQEACPGDYTYDSQTAAQDCGSPQAIACAVYMGPRSGKVSANPVYTNGRPQLLRIALAHEMQHIALTIGHTNCGPVPDNEPSIMSPADLARQLPCHDPPATWLNEYDMKLAIAKYGLNRPSPRPTPTPRPEVKVQIKRWTQPTWEPCEPNIYNWCVEAYDVRGPSEAGAWYQIIRILADGREEMIGSFQFVPGR